MGVKVFKISAVLGCAVAGLLQGSVQGFGFQPPVPSLSVAGTWPSTSSCARHHVGQRMQSRSHLLRCSLDIFSQGQELEEMLKEGADRNAILRIANGLRTEGDSQKICPNEQASGEWEMYAGNGIASRLEGSRVVIDWEKKLSQTKQGLKVRTLKILEGKGQYMGIVQVTERTAILLQSETTDQVRPIPVQVIFYSPKVLVLAGQKYVAVLKRVNSSKRIKPWDLPGYYEGFFTNERIIQEGEQASELDNLTPNVKLGVSVTVALVAMVSLFVTANPPPSKDQPLPMRSEVMQKASQRPPMNLQQLPI